MPSRKRQKKHQSKPQKRSALDVANSIKEMIRTQYPGMQENDAMRLAVLLTKVELEKGI